MLYVDTHTLFFVLSAHIQLLGFTPFRTSIENEIYLVLFLHISAETVHKITNTKLFSNWRNIYKQTGCSSLYKKIKEEYALKRNWVLVPLTFETSSYNSLISNNSFIKKLGLTYIHMS